ncbi:hypothetical protein bplSymb_SCF02605P001 [Bathymodiolus platifrons methanotrophic gill symbiont]|uniref:hypothetical protein n=1 Tax=Bathymodiolus platifrons methanotrophic gill symbiont TaxID=113268 RepID=UPI000B41AE8A|nr:hypothetical protein [Bathymodiolus platifrons methanotrophic gill symbiont]GAW86417.1 hypothetical protein bplSymb_SCF02605P001 [Bathymodiolus platifrons methanotrophic gill symbiont]
MNKQALIFLIMLVTSSTVMALTGLFSGASSNKTLPSLAAVEGKSCSVTMIGNFVGLTKAACGASKGEGLSDTRITVVSAKAGTKKTAHFIPHPKFDAKKLNPKYDIAVVILDSGFPTNYSDLVNLLPPIKEEQRLKKNGSRFRLYSAGMNIHSEECGNQESGQGSSTTAEWFLTESGCWTDWLFYKSFADINFESPSRLYQGGKNQVLPDWQIKNLFIDNGMTIEDLDESFFILAPSQSLLDHYHDSIASPVSVLDDGATATLFIGRSTEPLGSTKEAFVGFVHSGNLISRVLPHWSWILDVITKASVDYNIISYVNADKNRILSKIIHNSINAEKCNGYNRCQIGQIGFRSLSDKGTTLYFRLIGLNANGSFEDIPATEKDTENWEYLGSKLPKEFLNTTKLYKLGDNIDVSGKGLCFVYYNPNTKKVEYFISKTGDFEKFPINQRSNADWEYIGTENPDIPRTVYPKSHNNMTAEYLAPKFKIFPNLTLEVVNGRWARYIDLPRDGIKEGRKVRVARYSTWWTAVRTGYDSVIINRGDVATFTFKNGSWRTEYPLTIYPKNHNNMTANYLAPRFVRFSNLTLKVENGRWARYIELPLNYVAEGREVRVARYSTWWTEVRTGGDPVRLQKGKEVTFIFEGGVWKLKD